MDIGGSSCYSDNDIQDDNCGYTVEFAESCPSYLDYYELPDQNQRPYKGLLSEIESELDGEIDENEAIWLRTKREQVTGALVREYLRHDSIFNGVDSAIVFLAADTALYSKIMLTEIYLDLHEYGLCAQTLDAIPTSTEEGEEFHNYINWYMNQMGNYNTLMSPDETEEQALRNIAATNTMAGDKAMVLLKLIFNEEIPIYYEVIGDEDEKRDEHQENKEPFPSTLTYLYPNPTDGRLTLNLGEDLVKMDDLELKVFSLEGREILNIALNSEHTRQTLDISSLSEGVYIVEIYSNDRSVFHQKIILQ